MGLNQLLASVECVLSALEDSGLQAAIQEFRHGIIAGDTSIAERDLIRSADLYMDCAAAYGPADSALAEKLHLTPLQSPGFWFDISATTLDEDLRLSTLAGIQSNLEFASIHLPKLLSIADSHGAVGSDQTGNDNALIKVRIHDAVEKASFPDRISRLIDGVDMIYQACAELAGESPDGLEVMSVTGLSYRAVVFKGHPEVATATRRIIRALYQKASQSLEEEEYSVDQIAEQIPFMHAIDELFRVNALDADSANDIREGVLAGSIMILECGVRIHGDSNAEPTDMGSDATRRPHGAKGDLTSVRDTTLALQSDVPRDDELEYLPLDIHKKYRPAANRKN